MRHKPPKIVEFSKELRKLGHSISEIQHKIQERFGQSPSYETIRIYVKNIRIGARSNPVNTATKEAAGAATKLFPDLKTRDFYLIATLLSWPHGESNDFVITTSNNLQLALLVEAVKRGLNVPNDRFEFTIRVTPQHDKEVCLSFWSKILCLPKAQFRGYHMQKGGKTTAKFGVCRLRLTRGARMRALTKAIVGRIIELMK